VELCSGIETSKGRLNETSLAGLLPWAVRLLTDAGIESARFEMQLLLAQSLKVSRVSVIAATYPPPVPAQLDTFIQLVSQRAQRVPLAYLRGNQEFYGLPFRVTPDVLIPRPETELLVDFAIQEYKSRQQKQASLPLFETERGRGSTAFLPPDLGGKGERSFSPPRLGGRGGAGEGVFTLADVGTGTGCIPIAFLVSCPNARAVAYDLSAAALTVARENAMLNGVADRLRLIQGDLLTSAAVGRYDLIVSNPPYIPTAEVATLQPEVRDYEPRLALDGGPTGLDCYIRIAVNARRALKTDGALYLEVGHTQAQAVADLLRAAGMADVTLFPDLAGIDRVVRGRV
jgi:release factor glutamine methyltransferase